MHEQKKVLLLTYYWPPAGGAGVQRWLKMSKVLAQHVQLSVYHPKNADYPIIDESLNSQIPKNIIQIQQKIREPYSLARKINPKNKTYQKGMIENKENQSLLSKISLWIRANYFIPDARSLWIQPSYKFLKEYLEQNPQDVIISTGPPHSMHLIGLKLKQEFPKIQWIADFRDPWTNIDYFDKLPLNQKSLTKHQKLERKVLQNADVITTVSPTWSEDLSKLANKSVNVIFNGFDTEDFKHNKASENQFRITYIGSLNEDRNPHLLWETLDELCDVEDFKTVFELQIIGSIAPAVKSEIQQYENLNQKVIFFDYIPHKQAIEALQKSQILLLLINETANEKGIIPGKFFEYLAAKRQILCLGKTDSDIAKLLSDLSAGNVVQRDDKVEMKKVLLQYFDDFKIQKLNQNPPQNIDEFSRESAALQFLKLIEDY